MATKLQLVLCVAVTWVAACSALDVYVYGDSLSDNGNTLRFTGSVPRPDVYWKGRYSNGFGWVDWLTQMASDSITIFDNAYGGAPACKIPLPGMQGTLPCVVDQVNTFVTGPKPMNGNKRVHVIWGGHNDILATLRLMNMSLIAKAPGDVLLCLRQSVKALLDAGEGTVVLANMFPARDKMALKAQKVLNKLIKAEAFSLKAQYMGRATVLFWDVNKHVSKVIANYQQYGFTDVKGQCIVYGKGGTSLAGSTPASQCTDPQNHVFFDSVHPTDKVYREVALSFSQVLAGAKIIPAAFV